MATRFLGREKLRRRLTKLPQTVKDQIKRDFEVSAADLVKAMKATVAVDSGDLKATIQWNWATGKRPKYAQGSRATSDLSVLITAGGQVAGRDVRYAHIVEFGSAPHVQGGQFPGTMHPGLPARPFFFPVYRARRRKMRNQRRRAFRKGIEASRNA